MTELKRIGMFTQSFYPNEVYRGNVEYGQDGNFKGIVKDVWGEAQLMGSIEEGEFLEFNKVYDGRPPIKYSFGTFRGGLWVGRWHGEDCMMGDTFCELYSGVL